ncbi:MAG TPA: cell wall hydrolase [Limnochordia bacterium]
MNRRILAGLLAAWMAASTAVPLALRPSPPAQERQTVSEQAQPAERPLKRQRPALRPRAPEPPPAPVRPAPTIALSPHEIELMARLVEAEAQGEPYAGMVAVAAVVLNRLASPLFPKSIAGVVFEIDAFEAVSNGLVWRREPTPLAYAAVRDALSGWDPSGGALYYWNPATAVSPWVWSRPIVTSIGRHVFAV